MDQGIVITNEDQTETVEGGTCYIKFTTNWQQENSVA